MRAPGPHIATDRIPVASALGALTTFFLIYFAGYLSEDLFGRTLVLSPIVSGLLAGVVLRHNEINGFKRAVTAGLVSYFELYCLLFFSAARLGLEWRQPVLGSALYLAVYPPFAVYGPVASMVGAMFGWFIATAITDEEDLA